MSFHSAAAAISALYTNGAWTMTVLWPHARQLCSHPQCQETTRALNCRIISQLGAAQRNHQYSKQLQQERQLYSVSAAA